tara:strand:- start:6789 stop:6974 length:186 start_codon:yes stop_codon:yes gene_type:complete
MPYQIKKVGKKYKLYNLHKKQYVNKEFNSKESALSAGKNYMRYRKEIPVVKGNKILNKKKM